MDNPLEQRGLWVQPMKRPSLSHSTRNLVRRNRPLKSRPLTSNQNNRKRPGSSGSRRASSSFRRSSFHKKSGSQSSSQSSRTRHSSVGLQRQNSHRKNAWTENPQGDEIPSDDDSIVVLPMSEVAAAQKTSTPHLNINGDEILLSGRYSSSQKKSARRPASARSYSSGGKRPQSALSRQSSKSNRLNSARRRPQSARSNQSRPSTARSATPSYMKETSSSVAKTARDSPMERPQSAAATSRKVDQLFEESEAEANERFKKQLFGFKRAFVGPPGKISTTVDEEYYDAAVKPQLADRNYKHYMQHQRIPSGKKRLFRDDLQHLVRRFLKEDCNPEEKKLFKSFLAKLRNDLPKYENLSAEEQRITSTVDPMFFDVQQYAYTFFRPEWMNPLRAWFQDENNKEDHQLCRMTLSRFSTYYRATKGGTSYEDQFRSIPMCPRDRNLGKSLEAVVQERLQERLKQSLNAPAHPNRKRPQSAAASTSSRVKLTHAFETSYNQHYPVKKSDAFEKYLDHKKKRVTAQTEKKPFGTLVQEPYVTSTQADYPKRTEPIPHGYVERKQREVEFTASIGNRSFPRVNELQELEKSMKATQELQGVFVSDEMAQRDDSQKMLRYPKQSTHNETIYADTSEHLRQRMEGGTNGQQALYEYLKREKPTPYDVNFSGTIPQDIMTSEMRKNFRQHGTLE